MKRAVLMYAASVLLALACEEVDHSGEVENPQVHVTLDEVAKMFSELPIMNEHLIEVYDAVSSSSVNGYDEEYTMRDLFVAPGSGVGESEEAKSINTKAYVRPLRDLIAEYLSSTKSSVDGLDGVNPEKYMSTLENSDVQIYWPYSDGWDGETMPVITFDPGNGAEYNTGYEIVTDTKGHRSVREVIVDEELALTRPVWVMNRNSDSGYETLETWKKQHPEWGSGGGEIIILPKAENCAKPLSGDGKVRSLVLKDFKMLRNYDCWFAGASEFFFKCGSVEDFTASTEAELKLYSPQITDFMLVVKRSQMGKLIPLNTMLVSDWTGQLENVALMITEDDGGTRTDWKCSATVKIKSKSYGFDISLPFNTRDDIVWRGQLSAQYLEKYDGVTGRFGDTEVTFSFMER